MSRHVVTRALRAASPLRVTRSAVAVVPRVAICFPEVPHTLERNPPQYSKHSADIQTYTLRVVAVQHGRNRTGALRGSLQMNHTPSKVYDD